MIASDVEFRLVVMILIKKGSYKLLDSTVSRRLQTLYLFFVFILVGDGAVLTPDRREPERAMHG